MSDDLKESASQRDFPFTARVMRTDPKLKGTPLQYYTVNLRKRGANWESEGGVIFGGKTGSVMGYPEKILNLNSITPRNGK